MNQLFRAKIWIKFFSAKYHQSNRIKKSGSIMFSMGKMGRGDKLRELVRRTWSNSIGQRPMRVKQHISARLQALKPYLGTPVKVCVSGINFG
jgi:hypothetical protein